MISLSSSIFIFLLFHHVLEKLEQPVVKGEWKGVMWSLEMGSYSVARVRKLERG